MRGILGIVLFCGSLTAAPDWKTLAGQVVAAAQNVEVTAADIAAKSAKPGANVAELRDEIASLDRAMSQIQYLIYQMQGLDLARGTYRNDRLDEVKETGDRIQNLVDVENSTLDAGEAKLDWKRLHGYAKRASRQAARLSKSAGSHL